MGLARADRADARRARRRRSAARAARSHRAATRPRLSSSAACASAKRPVAASAVAAAQQQLDAFSAARRRRQQAQRAGEPARRRCRGARGGLSSRPRRAWPPRPCRRPWRSARCAGREPAAPAPRAASACAARSWAPIRQPAGRGLVDRAPDDRMAEAEAPRNAGEPDQIPAQSSSSMASIASVRRRQPRRRPARARTDRPRPTRPRSTRRLPADSSASSWPARRRPSAAPATPAERQLATRA